MEIKITKYENEKIAGITKTTLHKLEKIAMDASITLKWRGGIEGRYNDAEDFQDISVISIQRMLEEAYRLGKQDAQKK